MKALCLVAHPDDCVIFGYSFIYNRPHLDWTVAYLTYTEQEPRGKEFANFWAKRCIKTEFLGFEDHWHDQEQQQFTRWAATDAIKACRQLAQSYGIVLTHDQHGDYGHIHHRLVHDAVANHPGLVTFAPPGQGNATFSVPSDAYSLSEFPLHCDIVKTFHTQGHRNSYSVPVAVNIALDLMCN